LDILGLTTHIGVMTCTFQGHMMSSVIPSIRATVSTITTVDKNDKNVRDEKV